MQMQKIAGKQNQSYRSVIKTVAVSRTNYQLIFFLSLWTETSVFSFFVGSLWPSKKFGNVGVGCSCLSKM